jgi:hypothetical protein
MNYFNILLGELFDNVFEFCHSKPIELKFTKKMKYCNGVFYDQQITSGFTSVILACFSGWTIF